MNIYGRKIKFKTPKIVSNLKIQRYYSVNRTIISWEQYIITIAYKATIIGSVLGIMNFVGFSIGFIEGLILWYNKKVVQAKSIRRITFKRKEISRFALERSLKKKKVWE